MHETCHTRPQPRVAGAGCLHAPHEGEVSGALTREGAQCPRCLENTAVLLVGVCPYHTDATGDHALCRRCCATAMCATANMSTWQPQQCHRTVVLTMLAGRVLEQLHDAWCVPHPAPEYTWTLRFDHAPPSKKQKSGATHRRAMIYIMSTEVPVRTVCTVCIQMYTHDAPPAVTVDAFGAGGEADGAEADTASDIASNAPSDIASDAPSYATYYTAPETAPDVDPPHDYMHASDMNDANAHEPLVSIQVRVLETPRVLQQSDILLALCAAENSRVVPAGLVMRACCEVDVFIGPTTTHTSVSHPDPNSILNTTMHHHYRVTPPDAPAVTPVSWTQTSMNAWRAQYGCCHGCGLFLHPPRGMRVGLVNKYFLATQDIEYDEEYYTLENLAGVGTLTTNIATGETDSVLACRVCRVAMKAFETPRAPPRWNSNAACLEMFEYMRKMSGLGDLVVCALQVHPSPPSARPPPTARHVVAFFSNMRECLSRDLWMSPMVLDEYERTNRARPAGADGLCILWDSNVRAADYQCEYAVSLAARAARQSNIHTPCAQSWAVFTDHSISPEILSGVFNGAFPAVHTHTRIAVCHGAQTCDITASTEWVVCARNGACKTHCQHDTFVHTHVDAANTPSSMFRVCAVFAVHPAIDPEKHQLILPRARSWAEFDLLPPQKDKWDLVDTRESSTYPATIGGLNAYDIANMNNMNNMNGLIEVDSQHQNAHEGMPPSSAHAPTTNSDFITPPMSMHGEDPGHFAHATPPPNPQLPNTNSGINTPSAPHPTPYKTRQQHTPKNTPFDIHATPPHEHKTCWVYRRLPVAAGNTLPAFVSPFAHTITPLLTRMVSCMTVQKHATAVPTVRKHTTSSDYAVLLSVAGTLIFYELQYLTPMKLTLQAFLYLIWKKYTIDTGFVEVNGYDTDGSDDLSEVIAHNQLLGLHVSEWGGGGFVNHLSALVHGENTDHSLMRVFSMAQRALFECPRPPDHISTLDAMLRHTRSVESIAFRKDEELNGYATHRSLMGLHYISHVFPRSHSYRHRNVITALRVSLSTHL